MNDRHDSERDAEVSALYAKLSRETTTPELDEKILQAAQPSAGLRQLLALKPLSWAAITVLSVALVLELQRETSGTSEDRVVPTASVPDGPMHVAQPPSDAALQPKASPSAESFIAEPRNRSLQSAQEQAAINETLDVAPTAPTARFFEELDDYRIELEPERFCENIELVDASSWYTCVLRLREEGRVDEAAFELSLLRSAHPEFEIR
ncbi:MAG: hypothetical protein AAGA44_05475 [Pseudomonadota bacterium]